MNNNEFQYKRAMHIREKLKEEQSKDTNSNGENEDSTDMPKPTPPPQSEYTPLSLSENYFMMKAHNANYNMCLANATCPSQMKRLVTCWNGLDPQWVKLMQEQGIDNYICLQEREAIEHCVGLSVQRVMKDILG